MLLVWIIFGAIVGGIAASARGFSAGGGILGGAVLGLIAPLLFLVPPPRSCPHCGERIRVEATVCRHCRRDVPAGQIGSSTPPTPVTPMTPEQKRLAWGIAGACLSVFIIASAVRWFDGGRSVTHATDRGTSIQRSPLQVTAKSLAIAAKILPADAFAAEYDNRMLHISGDIAGITTRDDGSMEIELEGDRGMRVIATFVRLAAPPRRTIVTNQRITAPCENARLSTRGIEIATCGRLLQP